MTKDKPTTRKTPPDPIVVEEIFQQFNCMMGARLCDFPFYARTIPPFQEAYGREAVAAALQKIYATIRSRAAWEIRYLRRNAAWLKHESRKKTRGVT
jgi:hypothetical protein